MTPIFTPPHAWLDGLPTLGLTVSPTQLGQLETLYQQLLAYNQHTNLTRLTSPEDFWDRHVLESLLLSAWIPPESRIVDVGSGAGFPLLPLLLCRADLQGVAVESVGKKCTFLNDCRESLGLAARLTVLNERAETLGRDRIWRESFDVATARAVATLPTLLELCLPLVKPGGLFLAMKGPRGEEELAASPRALTLLKGRLRETKAWPELGERSSLVVLAIEKTGPTPHVYPRAPGTPAKKPL